VRRLDLLQQDLRGLLSEQAGVAHDGRDRRVEQARQRDVVAAHERQVLAKLQAAPPDDAQRAFQQLIAAEDDRCRRPRRGQEALHRLLAVRIGQRAGINDQLRLDAQRRVGIGQRADALARRPHLAADRQADAPVSVL